MDIFRVLDGALIHSDIVPQVQVYSPPPSDSTVSTLVELIGLIN